MRVKIGPYKKWWGPYQLADLIPFIGAYRKEMIGDWLAETWVNDVCEWFHSKNERTIKVHIDKYDTWSMDNTLAHIILPMLKQLKETKHGSPYVDNEDVPEHMRYDGDNWVHYKWEWVLNEMIWAFETHLDENWEEPFIHGTPDYEFDVFDDDYKVMRQKNNDYWVDSDKIKEYNDRIDNGFRLFGKYYRGLWD